MSNKNIKLSIKGMHCRSCELLIEEKLKELSRVESVDVNYRTGEAVINYHGGTPDMGLLNKTIAEAGYEIGTPDKLPIFSRDKKEYLSLGTAFLFLAAVFLILKGLGLTNLSVGSDLSNPGWGLILLIGLVAGFSTCMALVGGLSLGLSTKFAERHPNATPSEKFRPHLFFVIGRVISYTLLGGLLGALGTLFKLSSTANGILTLLIGIVMLIMGLQLINIFPRLNNFKLTLPKSIGKALGIGKKKKEYSHGNAMALGALTFFLPCGFTQAMQLYAISTGNFWLGALSLGLFALGTAPGLLSIGGMVSLIRGKFKERFFKMAGLAVIFFGLFNLSNGYTLASLNIDKPTGSKSIVNDPNVTFEDGIQIVRMTENNSGYSPNKFSIKKGVPVKWIITAKAPYSCASSLVVPGLNISKNLKAGENIIEFTPKEVGRLPFSCSMGMYTGVFNVYDGKSAVIDSSPSVPARASSGSCGVKNTANSGSGSGGCGCGGSGGSCGGGSKITPNTKDTPAVQSDDVQIIKATYTVSGDIQPNRFTVKAGKPVRFEVYAKEDGAGCMGTIQIQQLSEDIQRFEEGKTVVMEFTPKERGNYLIACAMNVPHGTLKVE